MSKFTKIIVGRILVTDAACEHLQVRKVVGLLSFVRGLHMVVAVVAVFYERERRETWGGGYSTAGPFGK